MSDKKPWVFFLLGVQWFAVFPLTVYVSERFEDTYRVLDEEAEPQHLLDSGEGPEGHSCMMVGST